MISLKDAPKRISLLNYLLYFNKVFLLYVFQFTNLCKSMIAEEKTETGLRTTLSANAIFSSTSGILLTLCASPLAGFMGIINDSQLLIVGINLLVFAGFLLWLVKRPSLPRPLVWSVVIGDILWVLFSGLGLVVVPHQLSQAGVYLILLVAALVAGFALTQIYFLTRCPAPRQSLY